MEKDAEILLNIETNEKLEEISKNTEASLLSQDETKEAIKELQPVLDANLIQSIENTEKIVEAVEKSSSVSIEIQGADIIKYKGEKGDKGDSPTEKELKDLIEPLIPTEEDLVKIIEPLIPEPIKGDDGQDYILTEDDKKEIAQSIEVPIVEKIIEKTEVIRETPITIDKTKTIVKEVAKYETAKEIAKKLNTLTKEIDFKAIKNFPDFSKGGSGLNTVFTDGTTILGNGLADNPLRAVGGGGGAVDSVNGYTGVVVLDTDDITDTATNRYTNDIDITRLLNTSGTNTGDNAVNTLYSGLASSKEDVANKVTSISGASTNTQYPSAKLLFDQLALKDSVLTFSTGLTRSTNTITVNTTQNIAKLSNLTSNGFVKTSGGDGTLSVDTNTYLTGNQTITLSGDITGSGATSITTTIANGAVDIAMLSATGTPSSSTYLRGDNTWATISAGGDVSKVGTPADNQIGVWTGDGTIEGTSGLTYNGSNLQLTGDIGSTGTRITKGWFTDLQVTNAIAGSITGNAGTVTNGVYTTGADSVYLTPATAASTYQPLDSDLTTIAGLTATTDNFIVSVSSAWASRTPAQVRTTLGLVIGTNVQAYDADLTTWAGITPGTGVGTALAVNVGTAGAFVTNGGALGTPSSATLTNATGLPIAGLVSSTSTALGVGSLELGHATDTTLSRVSAGVIAVEGVTIPTISSASTLTNKRIQPRTASSTTSSNLSPDLSTANIYYRTTQTATLTIDAPIGTPVIGETIMIYVDSAGAQTLTINATYIPFGAAFPATTTAGKTFMMSCQYNGTNWKTLWANAV